MATVLFTGLEMMAIMASGQCLPTHRTKERERECVCMCVCVSACVRVCAYTRIQDSHAAYMAHASVRDATMEALVLKRSSRVMPERVTIVRVHVC